MRAWAEPTVPSLPGSSRAPAIFDTLSAAYVDTTPNDVARLYVCGITPYDATHMGHAATYVAFDTLQRVWIDAGFPIHYTQNVTDVDDPLLERAASSGVHWQELGASQIELFRTDMEALHVLPPKEYIAVTDVIEKIAAAVDALWQEGFAYPVPVDESDVEGDDIYFDVTRASLDTRWYLGVESHLSAQQMDTLFRARGGDPERRGKRNPLDPLLWGAQRPGEPGWPSQRGTGRPGWHIECAVIAREYLGNDITVQGGASDLIFPHHEMSTGHAEALSGHPLARIFSHAGLVSYQGEKMSKSRGNLVHISHLRERGVDPRIIRLAIIANHYRSDWEWTDSVLSAASERFTQWSAAFSESAQSVETVSSSAVLERIRSALHTDLDTPAALSVLDEAALSGVDDPTLIRSAIDALLGVSI